MIISSTTKNNTLAIIFAVCHLLRLAVAPDPTGDGFSFTSSRAVVMKEGQVWQSGEKRFYHEYRCQVKLQEDGNFVVKRLVGQPHYMTYQTSWHTPPGSSDFDHYAKLDGYDGSLKVYQQAGDSSSDDAGVIYTSNVGNPEALNDFVEPLPREHQLTINEECVLEIFRGDRALWTNNRAGGLGGVAGISDYLQRGEMMHMNVCHHGCHEGDDVCLWVPNTLVLQQDCNLVQFRGMDWADYLKDKVVLWSSNTSDKSVEDCYLYSDNDRVRLYAGTLDKSLSQFEPRGDPVLWDGPLDFENPCSGGYEVLLAEGGGLIPSC